MTVNFRGKQKLHGPLDEKRPSEFSICHSSATEQPASSEVASVKQMAQQGDAEAAGWAVAGMGTSAR